MSNQQTHTLSLLVSNTPGVLSRISAVFARRAFNIDSLVVSPGIDGKFSRMTITAVGDVKILDQIIKQCEKLIDVVSAQEHSSQSILEKELALIKIKMSDKTRSEVLQVIQHINASTIDINGDIVVIQLTGNSENVDSGIAMVEKYGIIEIVRTGKVLMAKGTDKT
jgi:acetolactate synthase I/III small subunit